jgi:cytosine deaminase
VTPGLVDTHIHLDKALLSDRTPSVEGTLQEAIRITGEAKRRFTVEDIRARARAVLDMAVRHGTTAMRSHVEVDPIVELRGLEALLPLKAEYAPALDLQLCAFAQEGILQAPGTEALLAEALRRGADVIGGCPYNDSDPFAQIDLVFRLAREFGVDADFHVDFFDEPEHLHLRYIAEQTVRHGWQGRVALGHCTELAALAPPDLAPIADLLAEAGVAVITLPATDLYLMGRKDTHRVRRGLAPVKRLLAAGVTVAAATNNVRNAFTPVGNANLALMGFLLTVGAHMGTVTEQAGRVFRQDLEDLRLLRLTAYGHGAGGGPQDPDGIPGPPAAPDRLRARRRLPGRSGGLGHPAGRRDRRHARLAPRRRETRPRQRGARTDRPGAVARARVLNRMFMNAALTDLPAFDILTVSTFSLSPTTDVP